jgi:hypothetical protein
MSRPSGTRSSSSTNSERGSSGLKKSRCSPLGSPFAPRSTSTVTFLRTSPRSGRVSTSSSSSRSTSDHATPTLPTPAMASAAASSAADMSPSAASISRSPTDMITGVLDRLLAADSLRGVGGGTDSRGHGTVWPSPRLAAPSTPSILGDCDRR